VPRALRSERNDEDHSGRCERARLGALPRVVLDVEGERDGHAHRRRISKNVDVENFVYVVR